MPGDPNPPDWLGHCISDLSDAENPSHWCASSGAELRIETCGATTVLNYFGVGTQTNFYYDASGTLIAVVDFSTVGSTCVYGPSGFIAPDADKACSAQGPDLCLAHADADGG